MLIHNQSSRFKGEKHGMSPTFYTQNIYQIFEIFSYDWNPLWSRINNIICIYKKKNFSRN